MSIGFVLLAGCTAFDIFTNIGSEAGPPKFGHNKLAGFQVAGVASCFMVMAVLENSVAQGVVIGNVDTALIGQDAHFDLPVRKVGAEGKRDVFIHGLNGLKNEGVGGRGGCNVMG